MICQKTIRFYPVKHFALYGASEAGRDYNTVDMSSKNVQ
jgi:beta-glucosidase-like glycosyl hydrolase